MERKSPSSMETILSRVVNESRSDKEGDWLHQLSGSGRGAAWNSAWGCGSYFIVHTK